MDQEKDNDSFHNSEWGDVYDLYNACNGVIHDSLLDVRKLDELSPEECEFLNIPRLREVWEHTASGCAQCHAIITSLNSARERLRKRPTEVHHKSAPVVKAIHGDSL